MQEELKVDVERKANVNIHSWLESKTGLPDPKYGMEAIHHEFMGLGSPCLLPLDINAHMDEQRFCSVLGRNNFSLAFHTLVRH